MNPGVGTHSRTGVSVVTKPPLGGRSSAHSRSVSLPALKPLPSCVSALVLFLSVRLVIARHCPVDRKQTVEVLRADGASYVAMRQPSDPPGGAPKRSLAATISDSGRPSSLTSRG